MDNFKNEILGMFTDVARKQNDIICSPSPTFMKMNASLKELCFFDNDLATRLIECENIMLDSDIAKFNSLSAQYDNSTVIDKNDLFGHSELFVNYGTYLPSTEMMNVIKNNKDGFYVNVYNSVICQKNMASEIESIAMDASKSLQNVRNVSTRDILSTDIISPDSIVVHKYIRPSYIHDTLMSYSRNPIPMLAINLPIDFIESQLMKSNAIVYDIDTKELTINGNSIDEINSIINDMKSNGFVEPLVFRVNEACLTPIDDETLTKMIICLYLGFDEVPSILYMTDDIELINDRIENLFEIVYKHLWDSYRHISRVNKILSPYFNFKFMNPDGKGPNTDLIPIDIRRYISSNAIDENTNILDQYLDPTVEVEETTTFVVDDTIDSDELISQHSNAELEKYIQERNAHFDEVIENIRKGNY